MPRISVLMSVFNEPISWLQLAVDSIIKQSYIDFEFIIIIDNPGATQIIQVLTEYKNIDQRIKLISNEKNIGLTKSLNKGLKVCSGEYIARMDADDFSHVDRLKLQIEFLDRNQDFVLCGTAINMWWDSTNMIKAIPSSYNNEEIKNRLLFENCIAHSTVLIRNEILVKHNIQYDETFRFSQDYDLWLRLSHFGKFNNLETPLVNWRVSDNQISTKKYIVQQELSRKARYMYLERTLLAANIELAGLKNTKSIRQNVQEKNRRQTLITAFYCSLKPIPSILLPILNGDLFNMKYTYLVQKIKTDLKILKVRSQELSSK